MDLANVSSILVNIISVLVTSVVVIAFLVNIKNGIATNKELRETDKKEILKKIADIEKEHKNEIFEIRQNQSTLNTTLQLALITLTEIKNDLKWFKEIDINKKQK